MGKATKQTDPGDATASVKLPPARRKRLLAKVAAMPGATVKRVPKQLAAQIQWARGVAAQAVVDRDLLTTAPLEEPLTAEQLDELPDEIALLTDLNHEVNELTGKAEGTGGRGIAPLRTEMRGAVRHVLRAFEARSQPKSPLRQWVREVRRGTGDSDLEADTREVLTMAAKPEHASWISLAPRGEAEVLGTLSTALPRFVALRSQSKVRGPLDAATDARNRVWTALMRTIDRVRLAARYALSDDPVRRRQYRTFAATTSRRKKSGEK